MLALLAVNHLIDPASEFRVHRQWFSSIHRWLADGFIAGEQVTPGAPWQIRITDEVRQRIVQQAPPEYLPMLEATMKLGISRQTVLQRVKRGELQACS